MTGTKRHDEAPSTAWGLGDYSVVAERIRPVSDALLDVAQRRGLQLREESSLILDVACGTGNVALAAARQGARVVGVDAEPVLLSVAERSAHAEGLGVSTVRFSCVDMAATDALASIVEPGSADAALSSLGLIFVPQVDTCVRNVSQALKVGGLLGFTAWAFTSAEPSSAPLAPHLPPGGDFSPLSWGNPDVVEERLAGSFDHLDIEHRNLEWSFDSAEAAADWFLHYSPMHVAVASTLPSDARNQLTADMRAAMARCTGSAGEVRWESPYLVVTAVKRP